jgi:hypothetical protein
MTPLSWVPLTRTAQDVEQKIVALDRQAQQHLQEQKPQLSIPVLREIVSFDSKNVNARAKSDFQITALNAVIVLGSR